ncbi:MAG TPA: cytochrome c oxidase subunit II, partial [Bryobacteraceae bacterium]|nr:cytochrome c oxidase subunit II [Bryobacteraceae bacterium]
GLVGFAVIRYRHRREPGEPPQRFGSKRLETLWTAIPILIVSALFAVTVRIMAEVDAPRAPGGAPDVIITGHRWWWEARYPNGAVAAGEIHIPAGKRLLAEIASADVIHDFWAPQLARKMDAVPGKPGYIWLEADKPGSYQGACAEFCGKQHAWMRFAVIAQPEAEFSAWVQRQSQPAAVPASGPAAEGARLFQEKKCGQCHAIAGTQATGTSGPPLTHVASRQTLGSGISPNNPQNMALWINVPQSVKPGNLMPDSHLSEQETQALLAYMESLE